MARAIWNGHVLAESDDYELVGGDAHLPRRAVRTGLMRPNPTRAEWPSKGGARCDAGVVDGEVNAGATWYYPEPNEAAAQTRDHAAPRRDTEVRR
jgi:uncharacterized protein (DUF427 family)